MINRNFKRRQFIQNIIFCNIIHVFTALLIKWVCLCWIKVLFPLKKRKDPLAHPKQSCTTSFFPEEMFTSVVLQHADEWWHVNHEYKQEWHETFLPNWTRQLWLLLYSELVKEEFSNDDCFMFCSSWMFCSIGCFQMFIINITLTLHYNLVTSELYLLLSCGFWIFLKHLF